VAYCFHSTKMHRILHLLPLNSVPHGLFTAVYFGLDVSDAEALYCKHIPPAIATSCEEGMSRSLRFVRRAAHSEAAPGFIRNGARMPKESDVTQPRDVASPTPPIR
jgi:hypothetical protein